MKFKMNYINGVLNDVKTPLHLAAKNGNVNIV